MIAGLRSNGIEVLECHQSLWHGVEDRVQIASGGWFNPTFWWRVMVSYFHLLRRYRQIGNYDILIVGYPGQYDVFLARMLSLLQRKPLVWDVLNSMYLISVERGIAKKHRGTANLIRFLERIACRLPDMLILDSQQFIAWFQQTHNLSPDRFRKVPIGINDDIFRLATNTKIAKKSTFNGIFRILFYGSFIANHGINIIIEAANLLKDDPSIHFEIVGKGPEREIAINLAHHYHLKNVTFFEWLEKSDLVMKITQSNVCLGTFGDTLQASLTNNNKIYEGFALKKPVISGASPALPEVLKHGVHLYLCDRGNPQALVNAIITLKNDPELRSRLGENGYRIVLEQFNITRTGEIFASHLHELVS